jgi:GNAT superfamily N-acetyltransferase
MPVKIRDIEADDPPVMAKAFADIDRSKPVTLFQRYLREHQDGVRVVLVAFLEGQFAGYVTVCWQPDYPPGESNAPPEVQDLNVLPTFRRRGMATALLDRAEALVCALSESVAIGVGLHPGYNAAQRLYVLRGYVPDGRGVTYRNELVREGQSYPLDDHLVLHFTKRLRPSQTASAPARVARPAVERP